MQKTSSFFIIAIIISLISFNCSEDAVNEGTDPVDEDPDVIISENAEVVNATNFANNLVSFSSDSNTITMNSSISNANSFEVGDYIVTDFGSGVLKKINNVQTQGSNIVLTTENAALTDVVEKGAFKDSITLTPSHIDTIEYYYEGITSANGVSKPSGNIHTFQLNLVVWDEDGNYQTKDDQITLNGSFSLGSSLIFECSIKNWKLEFFNFGLQMEENLSLSTNIKLGKTLKKSFKIAKIKLAKIIFTIGVVPVVIIPEFVLNAGVECEVITAATMGIDQSYTYNVGMIYQNGGWSTYNNMTKTFTFTPPTASLKGKAKAYLRPELISKIYGLAGPYASAELYGELDVEPLNNPWWELFAGLKLGMGARMDVFDHLIFEYSKDIIDLKFPIAQAQGTNNQPPNQPSSPNPNDNATNVSTTTSLSWQCSDPDGDPLKYDIYFGTSSNPPLKKSNNTTTTYNPGTLNSGTRYYWKIVAKDDHSNQTTGQVWDFTTTQGTSNQPPDQPSSPNPNDNATNISTTTSLSWQCSDPDGDPLTYDVYFGTSSNPPKVVSDQNSTNYNPGTLNNGTKYYWKIVAKDDHSNQTTGQVWNFTTSSGGGGITPEMVFVQGGTFQMGSNDGDSNEQPVHTVTLSDFYIGKYEVTFAEFDAYCDATGSSKPDDEGWGRGNRPVINVSWNDAVAYCQWLSQQTGKNYRLPTEAEWEFAARGGNSSNGYTYSGSNTLEAVGWYYGNSGYKTHPVGGKQSNELGIYDMSGNVWEWCSDWYDKDYYSVSPETNPQGPSSGVGRVLRGGSWATRAEHCRSARRGNSYPSDRSIYNGFRLVRGQ